MLGGKIVKGNVTAGHLICGTVSPMDGMQVRFSDGKDLTPDNCNGNNVFGKSGLLF